MEVLDYQDTDAKEKSNDSSSEKSCASVLFSLDISMEEIELLVAQK